MLRLLVRFYVKLSCRVLSLNTLDRIVLCLGIHFVCCDCSSQTVVLHFFIYLPLVFLVPSVSSHAYIFIYRQRRSDMFVTLVGKTTSPV